MFQVKLQTCLSNCGTQPLVMGRLTTITVGDGGAGTAGKVIGGGVGTDGESCDREVGCPGSCVLTELKSSLKSLLLN